MLIDRAPDPEFVPGQLHFDFIKVPDIARLALTLSQPSGNLRTEFFHSAADAFI
nr:hypothetical protein [Palleronia caenipelagi]